MKCFLRKKIAARRELGSYTEDELELVEAELMGDIDDLIQEMRNFVLGLEAPTVTFEEEANTSEDDEEVIWLQRLR